MGKKGVRLMLFVIFGLALVCSTFVTSLPPPPPDIVILPPTYCDITNGGVEICDSIDNDCDGTVDENVCSSSTSSSSSSRKSSGSSSSSYIAPAVIKNTTNTTVSNNKTSPSVEIAKVNVSNDMSNIPPQVGDDVDASADDLPRENLFFGLSPLRILVYGSVMIVLVVSLLLFAFEYFTKRAKSRKDALSGTVPASQLYPNSTSNINEPSNLSPLDIQDERMINYVSEMRRRGYNDDAIMAELKKQNAQDNQVQGQNQNQNQNQI